MSVNAGFSSYPPVQWSRYCKTTVIVLTTEHMNASVEHASFPPDLTLTKASFYSKAAKYGTSAKERLAISSTSPSITTLMARCLIPRLSSRSRPGRQKPLIRTSHAHRGCNWNGYVGGYLRSRLDASS